MSGLQYIAAERVRQQSVEHFDHAHDDKHVKGELLAAAECYESAGDTIAAGKLNPAIPPRHWPWSSGWWKPSHDAIRNFIKAGALYRAQAELSRRRGYPINSMVHDGHAERCAEKIDDLLSLKPIATIQ